MHKQISNGEGCAYWRVRGGETWKGMTEGFRGVELCTQSGQHGDVLGIESLVPAYKAWDGHNMFCCGGRLMWGPDLGTLICNLLMVLTPLSVYWSLV